MAREFSIKIMGKEKKVKESRLDSVISYISPRIGEERFKSKIRMAAIDGAFTGASKSRRQTKTWNTTTKDADSAALYERDTLIERSRSLARNNPISVGAIKTVCSYAIGSGLSLHSKIDAEYLNLSAEQAEEIESQFERLFALWSESKDCDISRRLNFKELQKLALQSTLEGGDSVALLPRKNRPGSPFALKIQLVEGERLSNPNWATDTEMMTAGIEKDASGAPIRYHFSDRHPGSIRMTGMNWKPIKAFDSLGNPKVLHLYEMTRPGQTRGLPFLSPVIESLKMLSDLSESELMAALVTSFLTVLITTPDGNAETSPIPTTDAGTGSDSDEISLGHGSIVSLAQGEQVNTVAPNRPNAAFDPFFLAICRQIGVALEIPFEILVGHFTASFSASQAAILSAWRAFNNRRTWVIRNFCTPIYAAFIDEVIALGLVNAPGYFRDPLIRAAYLGAEWTGEGRGNIDPLKQAKADQLLNEIGVKTLKEIITETTGKDAEKTFSQWKREKKMVAEVMAEVNEELIPGQEAEETTEEEDLEDVDELDNDEEA